MVYWQKTIVSNAVQMYPFEVRPAVFELPRGGSTVIEVAFTPSNPEFYSVQMTMVCDNCHVRHFTITGQCHWSHEVSFTSCNFTVTRHAKSVSCVTQISVTHQARSMSHIM